MIIASIEACDRRRGMVEKYYELKAAAENTK
jgi:hypothetical protein